MNQEKFQALQESILERTGPCKVPNCVRGCPSFEFTEKKDGFRTCECGHTQQSHAKPVS
jgi:hypothetical protein